MPQLNPYISLQQNCREAMTFYQQCLGGHLEIQSVGETPMASKFRDDEQDKIMHSMLVSGSMVIMASGIGGNAESMKGSFISLCLNADSEEQLRDWFEKLSQGGTVHDQVKKEFWGGVFGSLTDKFGVRWFLNFDTRHQNAS